MICAKVENGVVVNSALWAECPTDWIESDAPIGYLYSNGEFTAPEKEPPTVEELEILAKDARDLAIESDIELPGSGAFYQINARARDNIAIALRKAERSGYPDTEERDWRLADNSWRVTTLGELNDLLEAYDARFESVWYQFNVWDAGPKDSPFVVEL